MAPLPQSVAEGAMRQLVANYIAPEVARRRSAGTLSAGARIERAQVVFFPDHRRPFVRLNDEVHAIVDASLREGTIKRPGDAIFVDDLAAINRISLTDDEPECGHATMVLLGSRWVFGFDARYNRKLAREHLDLADQFLALARLALKRSWHGPFVDNLFSAAELAAKATLLLLPDATFAKKTTHKNITRKYRWFAELGNVDVEFRKALDQLGRWRVGARYLGKTKHSAATGGSHLLTTVSPNARRRAKSARLGRGPSRWSFRRSPFSSTRAAPRISRPRIPRPPPRHTSLAPSAWLLPTPTTPSLRCRKTRRPGVSTSPPDRAMSQGASADFLDEFILHVHIASMAAMHSVEPATIVGRSRAHVSTHPRRETSVYDHILSRAAPLVPTTHSPMPTPFRRPHRRE